MSKCAGLPLTSDSALQILSTTVACKEQRAFFEAFVALVYKKVEARGEGYKGLLLVAADLSRLDLEVTAPTSLMLELAETFLTELGVPSLEGAEKFRNLTLALPTDTATLWCRLKRIGKQSPVADVGFTANHVTEPHLTDIVIPQSEDFEVLQQHAAQEKCLAQSCGSSLLPGSGALAPAVLEFGMAKSSKILLNGLSFFCVMGFVKPEDAMIKQLSACRAESVMVRAYLSMDGLTQLSLRLLASTKLPAKDTLRAMHYSDDGIRNVVQVFGNDPDVLEYAMDAQGSALSIGFTHPSKKR